MDSNTSATIDPSNMYNYLNGLATNPIIFAILAVIVLAYIVLFFSLGNSQQPSSTSSNEAIPSSGTSSGFMFLIAIVVIVLIVYNVLLYFFSIDIMASISNLLHGGNKINIAVQEHSTNQIEPSSVVPEIKIMPQVFNIPGNYYGYEDAKALCSAYGAKLANYDQIEKSYGRGAEWCNYGWSDGQMALFPTQKDTYAKLQQTPGHENDCGRPGINGGYMANPALKCYGYKPKITNEEEELMRNTQPYPKSEKDILMEKRVDYWQDKLDEILVSPFNYNTWSRI